MDFKQIFTKEKANALFAKILDGLKENKISDSNNIIAYAMKEAWLAGFEEGRKHPLVSGTN